MGQNKEKADFNYAMRLIEFKVKSLIGEFGFLEDDKEDLQQELLVHLLERLPRYDPARAAMRTFIDRLLDNKIRSMIKRRQNKKHDYSIESVSLSQIIGSGDSDLLLLEEIIDYEDCMLLNGWITSTKTEQIDLKFEVESILSLLPDDLRSLCDHLKTKSITEIIKETGEDRNRINHKIRKIRKLLKMTELKNYI
ncbi:MAG: sigma factor [Armatimonadota bacterium]